VPTFKYFLLAGQTEIESGSAAWKVALPICRLSASGEGQSGGEATATRGDYFEALRAFLEESPHHRLADAVSRTLGRPVAFADLDTVDICLEKHGQFYHPARVRVVAADQEMAFVVNAAFTEAGRALIVTDFENLRRLTHEFPCRFVPQVYHLGEVRTGFDRQNRQWTLFIGQWLEGYHEFHLQRTPSGGGVRMVVWDPGRGGVALTRNQTAFVYRLAARILTATYNLCTSEQVGAWHHAAGDFVLRTVPAMDLKLVTVRQYRPLLKDMETDIETVFQTLLLFLLNLSVRTRIDRDRGTGDLLWAAELAVPSTIGGFFEGLDLQVRHGWLPEELPGLFRSYLQALTRAAMADLLVAVVEKSFAAGAESGWVHRYLHAHACALQSAM
jgi:hypothetical protein